MDELQSARLQIVDQIYFCVRFPTFVSNGFCYDRTIFTIKLSKTAGPSIAIRDRWIAEFVNLHLQKILQRKQCHN